MGSIIKKKIKNSNYYYVESKRIDGKRKQGASVGTYLLMAAINRAVAPASTNQLSD